jgi:hypothetical protein
MDRVLPGARQWSRHAVLAAGIFLTAAPAALADPPGGSLIAPQQAAPQQAVPEIASTSAQPPLSNAPDPGASFLASAPEAYWRQLGSVSSRMAP